MPYELNTPSITSIIPISGVSGTAAPIPAWEILGIEVPTLDSATLQFYVSIDGTNFRKLVDGLGNTLLLIPASTGNYCIAARDCADLVAYTHVMPVAGAAQNTAARTITFRFRGTP